jgi:ribosomal protein L17
MTIGQKNQITAILITKNKPAKEAFPWCEQIITINPKKDTVNSRNQALEQAKNRWVIFLKSNESVSKNLAKEITSFINQADRRGFTGAQAVIKNSFLGKDVNYGSWSARKEIRLGRRVGKWEEKGNRLPSWQFPGQKAILSNPIIAKPYNNLSSLLKKSNLETTLKAQKKYQEGQRTPFLGIIAMPLFTFEDSFFLKLGFLDGLAGFILAVLEAFQTFLEKSKLWLLKHQEKKLMAGN